MANIKVKLTKKQEIANGTMAFHFEKPAGFEYKAGQTMDLTQINPPETDSEGNTRTFSIAAAPHEGDLMLATRMRDTAFKRNLKNMAEGTEIELEGPFGSFTLHNDQSKPAVFLAGGIGITPFRCMSLNAAKQKLPHKIYLFYSNRTPQDTAFAADLEQAEKDNPNFKLIQTMTNLPEDTNWTGERGYINAEMLKKYLTDINTPIYYIAGPQTMVTSLKKVLIDAGVNEDNIKFEEFSGY